MKPTLSLLLRSLLLSAVVASVAHAGVNLKAVDLDVLQKKDFGGYIDSERANELASQVATAILQDAGLLDPTAKQQLTLYVGYYRRFSGDETPFPVNNLVTPQYSGGWITTVNGQVISQKHGYRGKVDLIGIKGLFSKDVAGKQGKNFKRDLSGIASATAITTNALVQQLYADKKRYKAFIQSNNVGANAALQSFYAKLDDDTTPELASINDSPQYIPADVIADFRQRVSDADEAVRLKTYKELVLNPVNDKTVLDTIKLNLLTAAMKDVSADTQAWAAKALGAAGFSEYREALEQMSKVAATGKVKKHAKRSLISITNNPTYPIMLHDPGNRQPGQSWKSLQMVNQINSGRLRIQTAAAKQVFREGKNADDAVKAALAKQLEFSSMRASVRADVSGEFHAWALKALAASGDKKYLPLLNRVAKAGLNKKTRKYAKASAKLLKKA